MAQSTYTHRIALESTLCFPVKTEDLIKDEVLLRFRPSLYGASSNILYNGFGDTMERNESPEHAISRVLGKTICMTFDQKDLDLCAKVHISYVGSKSDHDISVYLLKSWNNPIIEGTAAKWFRTDAIPYAQMLPSDNLWLKQVLDGEKLTASILFDSDCRTVLSHTISNLYIPSKGEEKQNK